MADKQIVPVDTKDNFFSVPVQEQDVVVVSVNEVPAVKVVIPSDSSLNCYLKRQHLPLQYKNI